MPTEPVLVLFSGPKMNSAYGRPEELAYHTKVGELSFTSCSGVYLTDSPGAPSGALLLAPLTAFKPWLKTHSNIDKLWSSTVPELLDGCCLCVVGPDAHALPAMPLATVRLGASVLSAQQLLRSLNRGDGRWDEASRPWSLAWGVAGAPVTPAELASLVLCWVPPPGPPGEAISASYGAQQQKPHQGIQGPTTNAAIVPSTGSGAPLLDPTCLSALHQLHRAITQMAAPPHPSHADPTPWPPHAHIDPHPHPPVRPGQLVRVVGSPFGCLAPFHFTNASINGAVACVFPPLTQPAPPAPHSSSPSAAPDLHLLQLAIPTPAAIATAPPASCPSSPSSPLLALDAAVLPGMEGAPVWPLAASSAPPYAGQHPYITPHTFPHTAAQAAAPAMGATAVTAVATGGPLPPPPCPQTRPLALLATPLRRRSDGVQIPLALPWAEVEQQLLVCLRQLLVQQQGEEKGRTGCGEGCGTCDVQASRQGVQGVECAGGQRVDMGDAPGAGWAPVAARRHEGQRHEGQRQTEGDAALSVGDAAIVAAQAASGICDSPSTRSTRDGGHLHQTIAAVHGESGGAASAMPPSPFILHRSLLAGGSSPGAPQPPAAALTARPPTAVALGAPACAGPPAWAVSCVVLLRHGGSWATGVRVGPMGRLLITTAHLFGPVQGNGQGSQQGQRGAGARAAGAGGAAGAASGAPVVCWARIAEPGGAGGYTWTRARVLYSWRNHLDLAVLRLEDGQYGNNTAQEDVYAYGAIAGGGAGPNWRQGTSTAVVGPGATAKDGNGLAGVPASHPLGLLEVSQAAAAGCQEAGCLTSRRLEQQGYAEGSPVWAVGHSLVGPAAGWPAAVSYGCVAKILRCTRPSPSHAVPAQLAPSPTPTTRTPTMVIATASTHAGGSGGALLDSRGRLVGLVTSNARHVAGGTLPRLAFCIAAEELEPVVAWCTAHDQAHGQGHGQGQAHGHGRVGGVAAALGKEATGAARGGGSGKGAGSGKAAYHGLVEELRRMDGDCPEAARIWRLQSPYLEEQPAEGSDGAGPVAQGSGATGPGGLGPPAGPGGHTTAQGPGPGAGVGLPHHLCKL